MEDCGFGFGDWWLGLGSLVGLGLVAGVRWLGKVGDGFGVWVGVGKMVLKMEMKMGEEEEDGDDEDGENEEEEGLKLIKKTSQGAKFIGFTFN